jgi:IS1 family transposase
LIYQKTGKNYAKGKKSRVSQVEDVNLQVRSILETVNRLISNKTENVAMELLDQIAMVLT